MLDTILDVPGVKVGHYSDYTDITGCTVVLCSDGAVAGVDVRGSAPGTRETDLLRPMNLVQEAHAVVLSGGSAFGLATADGVMNFLEENGIGFSVGSGVVPIVPASILFDLNIGSSAVRPGPGDAYEACKQAGNGILLQGSVGAGTGATVGKLFGIQRAVKGGVGSASCKLSNGILVGALAVVNAWGSVVDPANGSLIAGPRDESRSRCLDTVSVMESEASCPDSAFQNTTLVVVATNASLSKDQANKVAQMAHDGIAMAVRPAHTSYDGDIVFAVATGKGQPVDDITYIGASTAQAVSKAILNGVTLAKGLGGVPSVTELNGS